MNCAAGEKDTAKPQENNWQNKELETLNEICCKLNNGRSVYVTAAGMTDGKCPLHGKWQQPDPLIRTKKTAKNKNHLH